MKITLKKNSVSRSGPKGIYQINKHLFKKNLKNSEGILKIYSIWTKTLSLPTPSQVRQQWTPDWCYQEYRTASPPGSQWQAIFPEGVACQHSSSGPQLPIAEAESCVKHSPKVIVPSFCSASTNGMEAPPWARTLRILRGLPPLSQLVRQWFQAGRSKPASLDATDTTIHWAPNS